jgi:hypothetical protein
MSITFSTERLITSEGFFPMERPMDSHGRMEQDERGGHLEFMGYVLYGVASGLASAVVLIDLFFNIQIYTSSYILGASAFLAINVGVTILYLRSVMGGAYGWATILAPVVPFVLLWWLLIGLLGIGRSTFLTLVVASGLVMVGLSSWSRSR